MVVDISRVGGPALARGPARRRTSFVSVLGRWWRGSAATLVFLLPMLLVFGLFSWWPIARTVVMSLQETNLVGTAEWEGLEIFRTVLADPMLPVA